MIIGNRTSGIGHRASGIGHRASGIGQPPPAPPKGGMRKGIGQPPLPPQGGNEGGHRGSGRETAN
ncbi:MAG: hypothetical protein EAZ98_00330 [Oscillatoriales cyanobacterium]|nr:MAG: hypothetical protein EA000_01530 [Oscillatoriales cyanobacterium]TAD95059.1 MAG: hypothetical protein EAZ96_27015 [Oscillatoriales cyanobacterium]TAE03508.1 MAG: hypothetical protein EAZ98_00330 [Oscillatoriales cyanobacterium]